MQMIISCPSGILCDVPGYDGFLPRPGDRFIIPASRHSHSNREMIVTSVTWDMLKRTRDGSLTIDHPYQRQVTVSLKSPDPGEDDYS